MEAFYCCLQNWSSTWSWSSSGIFSVPRGHNYILVSSSILYYLLTFEWSIMSITSPESTPSLKYVSAYVWLLFLVIFTLKIIAVASLLLFHQMLHETKQACYVVQSINFLDEHGILIQDSKTWFLQFSYSLFFFLWNTWLVLYNGLCNNWVSYNMLEIAGSDNLHLDYWSGVFWTWFQ